MDNPKPDLTQCRRTTLKGGKGVDDASEVRVWRCILTRGHWPSCLYEQMIGKPEEVRT